MPAGDGCVPDASCNGDFSVGDVPSGDGVFGVTDFENSFFSHVNNLTASFGSNNGHDRIIHLPIR